MKLFVKMLAGLTVFILSGPLWKTPPCGLLRVGLPVIYADPLRVCAFKWPPERVDIFLSRCISAGKVCAVPPNFLQLLSPTLFWKPDGWLVIFGFCRCIESTLPLTSAR